MDLVIGEEFLQLKGNKIPKGLVSLERIFDKHDPYVKKKFLDSDSSNEIE